MLRDILGRLVFALMGLAFGAALAVVLWYLYDFLPPAHRGLGRWTGFHADLTTWIKYVGGFFAAVGFVFKERVGDAMGDSVSDVYHDQTTWFGRLPITAAGIALLVLVILMLNGWSP